MNPHYIGKTVEQLMESGARKATQYMDHKTVITATRRFKPDKRNRREDIVLKIGIPNYREKKFIRDCIAAGVAFPLRSVQLKWWKE